ncbi:hypothetical protein ACIGXM_18880 [Kitasatospora sp. NPDC052896]|uniref:hypothetical protein n=1 Tax=Kitasatospora sp. NPDC052896 TaxID=3364061 RepID=UPI0037C6864E
MRNRTVAGAVTALLAVVGLVPGADSAQASTPSCSQLYQVSPFGNPIGKLTAGQSLDAPSKGPGQNPVAELVMQGDGNLVEYLLTQDGGRGPAIWNTGTWGHPGAYVVSQGDGNLVLYSATGTPLWDSGTWGGGQPAQLLADGNLFVTSSSPSVLVWTNMVNEAPSQWCPSNSPATSYTTALSSLGIGGFAQSPNAWLVMQFDGNLVIYRKRDNAVLWNSGTAGSQAQAVTMQADGNMVINGLRGVVGSTGTGGHPGAHAVFQTDGNFVVSDANGTPLWNTGTWGN